jgi:uncharacterized protein YwgA
LTPVQLQKTAFLLGQEHPHIVGADYYEFVAYDYGPFNQDIYRDVEALAEDGLAAIEWSANGRWKEYRATQRGIIYANKLRTTLQSDVVNSIDRLVTWARGLSFQELVRAVYDRYPAYRANSVFQD